MKVDNKSVLVQTMTLICKITPKEKKQMASDVITRVAQLNTCMRARNGHARTHAWHQTNPGPATSMTC